MGWFNIVCCTQTMKPETNIFNNSDKINFPNTDDIEDILLTVNYQNVKLNNPNEIFKDLSKEIEAILKPKEKNLLEE